MDRSKYRNPDMPVGYVKKEPDFKYKEGIEIDGEHLIWAPWIYDLHLDKRADYATLGELIIMSDDEDLVVDVEERFIIPPQKIKKEKGVEESTAATKKAFKHEKKSKSHSNNETSNLSISLSHMDIETEKPEKKKKIKIKKERRSASGSPPPPPSSGHKHKKSKEHKSDSKSDHKSGHRSDSTSPPHSSRKHKKSVVAYSSSPPLTPERYRKSPERYRKSPERYRKSPEKHRKSPVRYPESPERYPRSPERYPGSPERYPGSPERYPDVKIKMEPIDKPPEHLFGLYHCEVCNITMNSLLTYNTHINGKRHRKNMKAKNVPEVAALSVPATVLSENESRYPKPRPGVIRKKVQTLAQIQHIIERDVKVPCPGLNHVTEIQGIECVQYYCAMCDCVCSSNSIIPHLTGYKHQLKSVKEFKPGAYDHMSYEPKYKIEKELLSILRAVQKKEGMGRMAVEVEELSSQEFSVEPNSRDLPSTSWGANLDPRSKDFKQLYNETTVPDPSASDFFCDICQSHMNSRQMWESHIRGKRHLTNLKKLPGDRPSKIKTIPIPDRKCRLLDRLKAECADEPIVGLKEIRETQIIETNSYSYQCFLCGSCHTSLDIIEHLISLKHRTKYLDHIRYPGKEVINGMSDGAAYGLVREMCEQVESEEGRPKPDVHISKNWIP